jgi:DNA-nicking Smr family endonuclease
VKRPTRLQGFGELGAALKRRTALAAQEEAAQRERQRAEAAARRLLEQQQHSFALAVGPVTPLAERRQAKVERPRPAPEPLQRQKDEQAALRSALSDEVDVESLLLTDDGLSKGHWAIQQQIDLHGLRRDEARDALTSFLRQTRQQGLRCLRVVHGKGLGSPGREPVLKGKVQRWLAQCDDVVAFAQAAAAQGGAGALIVLLGP